MAIKNFLKNSWRDRTKSGRWYIPRICAGKLRMKFGYRSKQHRDLKLKTLVYASTRARRNSGERTHARYSGARRGGRQPIQPRIARIPPQSQDEWTPIHSDHGLTDDSDVVVEAFVSNAWLGAWHKHRYNGCPTKNAPWKLTPPGAAFLWGPNRLWRFISPRRWTDAPQFKLICSVALRHVARHPVGSVPCILDPLYSRRKGAIELSAVRSNFYFVTFTSAHPQAPALVLLMC